MLSRKEYLECGGSQCPVCLSKNIQAEKGDTDGLYHYVPVECLDCGATWNDVYELYDIEDIKTNRRRRLRDNAKE